MNSVMDKILEDAPHLREYARQRTLVNTNMRKRMIKGFKKASTLGVKQLSRQSKVAKAHEFVQKMALQNNPSLKNGGVNIVRNGDEEADDSRNIAY